MGMDLVEIVLAVEDHFNIDIRDEDASRMITVGDLQALVVARLERDRRPRARFATAAFHRARKALSDLSEKPRSAIRPQTPLDSLLPAAWPSQDAEQRPLPTLVATRRATWQRLSEHLGTPLPPLERPLPMRHGLNAARIAPFLAGLASGWSSDHLAKHALVGLAAGMAAGATGAFLTRHHAYRVPEQCTTVAGLVHTMLRLEWAPPIGVDTSAEQVLEDVITIASKHLGIPRERIQASSSWVQDLGAD